MEQLLDFLKAFLVGFIFSTPITPTGILCLRRSIHYGPLIGFFSGLGSATADFFISIIAFWGLSYIMDIIVYYNNPIRIASSLFLMGIGLYLLTHSSKKSPGSKGPKTVARSYFSIFFLTLSNPVTIPFFAAIFTGLGIGIAKNSTYLFGLACSVACGAATWWALLAGVITAIQPRITYDIIHKINTLCGIIIFASGLITIIRILYFS